MIVGSYLQEMEVAEQAYSLGGLCLSRTPKAKVGRVMQYLVRVLHTIDNIAREKESNIERCTNQGALSTQMSRGKDYLPPGSSRATGRWHGPTLETQWL